MVSETQARLGPRESRVVRDGSKPPSARVMLDAEMTGSTGFYDVPIELGASCTPRYESQHKPMGIDYRLSVSTRSWCSVSAGQDRFTNCRSQPSMGRGGAMVGRSKPPNLSNA